MAGWNFATAWEAVADAIPDAPCQVQGPLVRTWAEVDRRADGVAQALLDAGIAQHDKMALYLYNGPEYLEAMWAAFKVAMAPVNTNYRYGVEELVYLWDNADATAVVFHGTFVDNVAAARERLPGVKAWLWVDDGTNAKPDWALDYQATTATPNGGRVQGPWGRSGDDLLLLYTGGTTGMPKGVMWRVDDLFSILNASSGRPVGDAVDYDKVRELNTEPGMVVLPAAPLMHGTGMFAAVAMMTGGGSVVTLTNRSYDPVELLDTIEARGVNAVAWVGDAFAKPFLRALDAKPGGWDLSSLFAMISSGVMWSNETKAGLLRHHPTMILSDSLSSSEAIGLGASTSMAGAEAGTATFTVGDNTRVITDDGREVEPGSGDIGRVAITGRVPLGYYKDEEKSAKTFLTFDGKRYSVPGDYATVEADGTLVLLGRGSVCINTGGEKVFPEEVEEVLKLHPDVRDAVAVGVPDDKYGEIVTAVVEGAPDVALDPDEVIAHVRSKLAAYKAPKRVVVVPTIGRAPNGKVDYKRARETVLADLAS